MFVGEYAEQDAVTNTKALEFFKIELVKQELPEILI